MTMWTYKHLLVTEALSGGWRCHLVTEAVIEGQECQLVTEAMSEGQECPLVTEAVTEGGQISSPDIVVPSGQTSLYSC